MSLSDLLEKLGRRVFEDPFGGGNTSGEEPPEMAEVRHAILDEIRKKSYRSGGKKIFPFNFVRINLRGVDAGHSAVLQSAFLKKYFNDEVISSLAKSDCRYPADLQVDIITTADFPKPSEPWVWIETESREPGVSVGSVKSDAARLTVLAGKANYSELILNKPRTNIGRIADVYRAEGLSRRNDLTFAEEDEINRTVSREHAHISHEKDSGEYRLFNDRWYDRENRNETCGIWIVRGGMSQEVHRTTRGTKLLPGDEIHFGKAVVRFGFE